MTKTKKLLLSALTFFVATLFYSACGKIDGDTRLIITEREDKKINQGIHTQEIIDVPVTVGQQNSLEAVLGLSEDSFSLAEATQFSVDVDNCASGYKKIKQLSSSSLITIEAGNTVVLSLGGTLKDSKKFALKVSTDNSTWTEVDHTNGSSDISTFDATAVNTIKTGLGTVSGFTIAKDSSHNITITNTNKFYVKLSSTDTAVDAGLTVEVNENTSSTSTNLQLYKGDVACLCYPKTITDGGDEYTLEASNFDTAAKKSQGQTGLLKNDGGTSSDSSDDRYLIAKIVKQLDSRISSLSECQIGYKEINVKGASSISGGSSEDTIKFLVAGSTSPNVDFKTCGITGFSGNSIPIPKNDETEVVVSKDEEIRLSFSGSISNKKIAFSLQVGSATAVPIAHNNSENSLNPLADIIAGFGSVTNYVIKEKGGRISIKNTSNDFKIKLASTDTSVAGGLNINFGLANTTSRAKFRCSVECKEALTDSNTKCDTQLMKDWKWAVLKNIDFSSENLDSNSVALAANETLSLTLGGTLTATKIFALKVSTDNSTWTEVDHTNGSSDISTFDASAVNAIKTGLGTVSGFTIAKDSSHNITITNANSSFYVKLSSNDTAVAAGLTVKYAAGATAPRLRHSLVDNEIKEILSKSGGYEDGGSNEGGSIIGGDEYINDLPASDITIQAGRSIQIDFGGTIANTNKIQLNFGGSDQTYTSTGTTLPTIASLITDLAKTGFTLSEVDGKLSISKDDSSSFTIKKGSGHDATNVTMKYGQLNAIDGASGLRMPTGDHGLISIRNSKLIAKSSKDSFGATLSSQGGIESPELLGLKEFHNNPDNHMVCVFNEANSSVIEFSTSTEVEVAAGETLALSFGGTVANTNKIAIQLSEYTSSNWGSYVQKEHINIGTDIDNIDEIIAGFGAETRYSFENRLGKIAINNATNKFKIKLGTNHTASAVKVYYDAGENVRSYTCSQVKFNTP